MAGQFAGKVALVTGAGSGIGRASALAFARDGAQVVAGDIDVAGGQETVRQIVSAGGEARFIAADVTDPAAVEALMEAALAAYGRLDCAFNNAGISGLGGGLAHEYPLELWDRVLRTNLTGVWLCMRAELPRMLARGGGAIVNTASIMGLVGGGNVAYNAAKHGVVGLTRQAALEYARQGVRVNAVCPGFTETPMVQVVRERRPGLDERVATTAPAGRFGGPEEIAAAVTWLCSDAAAFVTGVALPVDGGWTAQ
jgi:NAD(P)-dependent dehydrogenase (short-subunit alcohol dehydrogenase family)